MQELRFINYSHPSEQKHPENRRRVASYIGVHFRNRSKPSNRSAFGPIPGESDDAAVSALDPSDSQPYHPYLNWTWRRQSPYRPITQWPQNIACYHSGILRDKHGIRFDPFYSYPVDFRPSVPRAVDFWIHVYGPTHIIRPDLLSAEQGAAVLREYFQCALDDPVLFEALVTVSQANLSVQSWEGAGLDKDTLHHYGQTVQRLRKHLSDENGYRHDSVLLAIIALIAVDYLSNDMGSLETHLKGVRRIVALRGGIDAVGWPLILKPYLVSIESFWGYISRDDNVQSESHHEDSDNPPRLRGDEMRGRHDSEPVADLMERISTLPSGFACLALNHQLSGGVIDLLCRIVSQQDHINAMFTAGSAGDVNGANLEEIENCMRLLGRSDLTLIERVCCMGVVIRLTDPGRLSGKISAIYVQEVQRHATNVLGWQRAFSEPDLSDCFLWLAMCMAATMFPPQGGPLPSRFRDDSRFTLLMAVARQYEGMAWGDVLKLLHRFFTIEAWLVSWAEAWRIAEEELRGQNEDLHPQARRTSKPA